jgi:galactokinase
MQEPSDVSLSLDPASPTMTRTFWAPGRVNLIGEHTDYSGGLVFPIALDRGITLTVEGAHGPMALTSADGDVGRYADAMLAELEMLGRPAISLTGRIESDLPIGAGLSSSAALEVALGLALCAVADFALDPLALAQVAQRAEHRATGVPCGIMDQAVSLLGREGHALLLDTGSLEWELVPLPPELRIVVIDSGVRRRLEHSGYAERRAELERGLAGAVDPVALRRVRHVHSENERVREVVKALRSDPVDLGRLGELFLEGHVSLRDDFEVSTPELDFLVDRAYSCGAVAARMTGGGFGGSIVALVTGDTTERFMSAVVADTKVEAFVTRAASGAHEVPADPCRKGVSSPE